MKKRKSMVANVKIFDDKNIYTEYGFENEKMIDESLTKTIKEMANSRPIREKLIIHFTKSENVKIDKEEFKTAYKNTFKHFVDEKKLEAIRCLITGLSLLVLSVALILFENFVVAKWNSIAKEFSTVTSWVFFWASIETLTIHLIQIIIEIRKLRRMLDAHLIILDKEIKKQKN